MRKTLLILSLLLIGLSLSGCQFYYGKETLTMEEAIEEYGGYYSQSYDYDLDLFLYYKYYQETIDVCIDATMDQRLIDASILAVEEYSALAYFDLTYYLSDDYGCSSNNTITFTVYRDSNIDLCGEDDSDTYACNNFFYDDSDGGIFKSIIAYNLNMMELDKLNWLESVALHELGHTFGLDDLYLTAMAEHSVMYGYDFDDEIITDLTQFDLYNIDYIYKPLYIEEVIEYFGGDYGVLFNYLSEKNLYFENYQNVKICIDDSIDLNILSLINSALDQYGQLDIFTISEISSTCSIEDDYNIWISPYSEADEFYTYTDGVLFNYLGFVNIEFEEFGDKIYNASIFLNTDYLNLSDEEIEFFFLRSFGYAFGLDFVYEPLIKGHSIMYFDFNQAYLPNLTQYDIYNLEYLYLN